jgi:LmbE family N-acetylglucosaminyl deacetylase
MPTTQPFRKCFDLRVLAGFLLALASLAPGRTFAETAIATDQTNYNVGSAVMIRSTAVDGETASIRYAGETAPLQTGLRFDAGDYQRLWMIPWDAKTGRYEIDLTTKAGTIIHGAAGFAVHRQLAKVISFTLDKTFYTSGDAVNPRIVVQNISNQPIHHLQVEFEGYTYPWIAPAADSKPAWKTIAATSLTLAPGETKEFLLEKAATVQVTGDSQAYIYYSAILRDSEQPDHIYDLAFALPAITAPLAAPAAKTYPALYLYHGLKGVPASEAYRQFYPPPYVSQNISIDKQHTMFPTHASLPFSFLVQAGQGLSLQGKRLEMRVLDRAGKRLSQRNIDGAISGHHAVTLPALPAGLYTLEVTVNDAQGTAAARALLDFAVNDLPKSILVFCAHEDDDTAHPELIRAAVENHIPIHVVYFTSGDAGGCDRYYMHSCDAARAMDFGEVRMGEARASLGHLGVPAENIFFLGLPDGGMEQIWHSPNSDHPYLSVLLASEHSPYRDAAIPNLPYARDAVIAAAEGFITKYKPEMIITGHPDERHVDHRTNNWVVVKAMQNLVKRGTLPTSTQLIVDQVYGPGPQKHAPYQYEKTQFYVSGEAASLGQEATWYYQTQDGNHQQAEIATYGNLRRDASPPHFGDYRWPYPHYRILDWQKHEGWNE